MYRRQLLGGLVGIVLSATAVAEDKKADSGGWDSIKKLSGTWVQADDKGKPTDQVVSVFRVIAAGSAVEETIFPGSGHEMVTVYHRDGKDVVLTHYCALGNQPHLKLDPAAPKNKLAFKFIGGSNVDPAKDMHMHEGNITIVDDDHIDWSWQAWQDGKPQDDHKIALKLVRKK